MRIGRRFSSVLLLLVLPALLTALTAGRASADIVYLTNGRTFDGVVAEEGANQVKVQIEGGSLTLPRSAVARVEKADSSLGEFLQRRADLRRQGAGAKAWLDLAHWADSMGLSSGAREAALTAASLDPQLPGLDRELRAQNYLYDPQLGRWLPFADEMRRRGMVLEENGDWVTRQEHAERVRERAEAQMQQQAAQAQAMQAQADLMRAQADLYGGGGAPYGYDNGGPSDLGYGYGFPLAMGYGYGSSFAPGFGFGRGGAFRRGAPFRSSVFSAAPRSQHRQPASLIRHRPPFRGTGRNVLVPVAPHGQARMRGR